MIYIFMSPSRATKGLGHGENGKQSLHLVAPHHYMAVYLSDHRQPLFVQYITRTSICMQKMVKIVKESLLTKPRKATLIPILCFLTIRSQMSNIFSQVQMYICINNETLKAEIFN